MTYEFLILSHDGNVATLTLNRPEKRNALSSALRAEMARAFGELAADDSVSVVVLTGAGVPCSGYGVRAPDRRGSAGSAAGREARDQHARAAAVSLGRFVAAREACLQRLRRDPTPQVQRLHSAPRRSPRTHSRWSRRWDSSSVGTVKPSRRAPCPRQRRSSRPALRRLPTSRARAAPR